MTFKALLLKLQGYLTLSRNIYIATGLLICLFVALAGNFTGSIINNEFLDPPLDTPRFFPAKDKKSNRSLSYNQFKDIIEQNVFDAKVVTEKSDIPVTDTTRPTGDTLSKILDNLTLQGIYRGKVYLCILYDKKNRREDTYAVGEEVFDTGAFVEKIVVRRNERKVYIRLNNDTGILEQTDEESEKKAVANIRKPTPGRTIKPSSPAVAPKSEYTTDGAEFFLPSNEVEHHLKDFAKLLNQARVIPYFENGKNVGYKIKAIDKGSLYEKLGLQNNDVIKKVNGEEINSMEKAMMLFKAFRNERDITIVLERNKQTKTLNYHIN